MYTLGVLVAVTAACVFARPPVPAPRNDELPAPADTPAFRLAPGPAKVNLATALPFAPEYIEDYLISDYPDQSSDTYEDYDLDLAEVMNDPEGRIFLTKLLPSGQRSPASTYTFNSPYHPLLGNMYRRPTLRPPPVINPPTVKNIRPKANVEVFAMTPRDIGYFDAVDTSTLEMPAAIPQNPNSTLDPREPRQNPNLSRTKTLVASNLDKLRIGLSEEPSEGTDHPELVHVYDTKMADSGAGSMYSIALMSGLGAALALGVGGFLFGWYSLSKRAKAAADVDYPAYGVTGPTAELAGDRKLAHSAHMYHYQHQKQQIIAMERSCCDEQGNGSVSEPESDDDNEEGDYTVYECPGFATTGDMEVKNPMFKDDQTPATPGKCEIVKPQPSE